MISSPTVASKWVNVVGPETELKSLQFIITAKLKKYDIFQYLRPSLSWWDYWMDRNGNFESSHFKQNYYFLVLGYVWIKKILNISTKFGFLPYFSFFSGISSKKWIRFWLWIKFLNGRHLLIFYRSVSCKIQDNSKISKIIIYFEKQMDIYRFLRGHVYPS